MVRTGQPPLSLRCPIGGHLPVTRSHTHACVHDAGDPIREACAAGIVDRLNEFLSPSAPAGQL